MQVNFYDYFSVGNYYRFNDCVYNKGMTRNELLTEKQLKRLRETDREYQRRKYLLNPNAHKKMTYKYWKKHPERYRCTIVFHSALKSGKIKKKRCEKCGEKAVGHHPRYDRPLSVVWLCNSHHKLLHCK